MTQYDLVDQVICNKIIKPTSLNYSQITFTSNSTNVTWERERKRGAGAEAGAGATIFRSSRFGSESGSDFLKIYIFFIFFNF